MAQQWLYARDQITINSSLEKVIEAEITANHLGAGDTVVLAARVCTHDPAYVWKPGAGLAAPLNVMIIADSYVLGSGLGTGGIDVSGPAPGVVGKSGSTGTPGIAESAPYKPIPAGPGSNGGPGAPGSPVTGTITIIAGTLDPVTLHAVGAAGGAGGRGGIGGAGADSQIINKPGGSVSRAAPGGNGGNGGAGGSGSAGGTITVSYVTVGPGGKLPTTAAAVAGGAAGPGGAAGAAGYSPMGTAKASAGLPGANGQVGGNGTMLVSAISESAYWTAVTGMLTPANLAAWADYRLSVGRYLYRTFNGASPADAANLLVSYNEFEAVSTLGVANSTAQATQWSAWIANNLNALGLPYDVWIKPDFDSFEQTYVGYAPLVAPLVQAVFQLVSAAVADSGISAELGVMEKESQNELTALTADLAAAQLVVSDDQGLLANLNQQMATLQGQIEADKAALLQAQYEFTSGLPMTAAWDVIQAVATLAPAVGPVLGLVGLVVPSTAPAGTAQSVCTTNMQDRGNSSQNQAQNQKSGGLSGLIGDTAKMVSLFKSLTENGDAAITADQADIQKLTAQVITLKFQILQQADQLAEARLQVAAVQAHQAACAADISAIQAGMASVSSDMSAIADLVGTLMDTIARISEYVVRYVFLAARALDIFAFTDGSVVAPASATPQPMCNVFQLPLDFGVVLPDTLADALLALRRNSAAEALSLFGALAANWAQAPAWSKYTQQGTDLANALSPGQVWIPITDPAALAELRSTGSTTFEISAADLPADSYELKISRMYLNLLGATSTVPSLSGSLTHSGYAQAIRRDGSTLLLSSQPMTSFVSAGLTSGQVPPANQPTPAPAPAGPVPVTPVPVTPVPVPPVPVTPKALVPSNGPVSDADLQMFYGRSPAATWSFTIVDPNSVDLSGLTQIQVGLEFLAIAK